LQEVTCSIFKLLKDNNSRN